MATYVYGIVEPEAAAPAGEGIDGAPLAVLAGDRAAALISDLVGDELRLGRDAMLTHARVLELALQQGTVLPMRFGIVMDGSEEVKYRLLEAHGAELRAQLDELKGKVEVRIRAAYEEDSVLREVVRDNPEIAELRRAVQGRPEDATYYERIRLGEIVARAVERRREHDAEAVLEGLAGEVIGVEVGDAVHERVVVNASFLVASERLAQFDETLERLAAGQAGRMRFKYTGPLPPHSFVQFSGPA